MEARLSPALSSACLGLLVLAGCQQPQTPRTYLEDLSLGSKGDPAALERLSALSDDELASVLTIQLLSFTDRDRPKVVSMNLFKNLSRRIARSGKIAYKMFALVQEFSDSTFMAELFVEDMRFNSTLSLIEGGLRSRADDNALVGSLRCAGVYGGQPESKENLREVADLMTEVILWNRSNERRRPMQDEYLNTEITIAGAPYGELISENLLKRLPEVSKNVNSVKVAIRIARASKGLSSTRLIAQFAAQKK